MARAIRHRRFSRRLFKGYSGHSLYALEISLYKYAHRSWKYKVSRSKKCDHDISKTRALNIFSGAATHFEGRVLWLGKAQHGCVW